ncbi:MAG: tetratricopeptide repeat protein [Verrucomicrobia bacterium]|nr:tetratricopeptide repeat protein [Verrucomicrobiota bacterium]
MTRRIWFTVWMELVGALALLGFSAQAEQVSPSTAWDAYRRGNYQQSQSQYSELAKKSPTDPRLRFNAGAAAFRQNDLTNAANWFESVLAAPDLQLQQQAYYNLGNTRYRLGESLQDPQVRKQLWSEALTNFVSAMKLDQSDTNAAANYAYVRQQLQQLEQQQPPPQQQQQQQKQNQQKNEDQKDQDNDQQDSQDQQQKDQQKQDPSQKQQDNSGSQDQKQSGQPDQEKENSGADPQSGDEKSKSESEKESEAKSSQPGESGEGKEGQEGQTQGAEAGEGEAGQMSAAQAIQMLESRKGDEKALLLRSTGSGKEAAERAARIRKPW